MANDRNPIWTKLYENNLINKVGKKDKGRWEMYWLNCIGNKCYLQIFFYFCLSADFLQKEIFFFFLFSTHQKKMAPRSLELTRSLVAERCFLLSISVPPQRHWLSLQYPDVFWLIWIICPPARKGQWDGHVKSTWTSLSKWDYYGMKVGVVSKGILFRQKQNKQMYVHHC